MACVLLLSGILCCLVISIMALDDLPNSNILKKEKVLKQNENINYTEILNFWKKHKNEFVLHGNYQEVVLVMGNTGAGKTTLALALTRRELKSVERDGYFVIEDDEHKIGTGTSSKTLVPEIMTDIKRNVTYVDCSGFRDNRNVQYEISSVYFQNILMGRVKKMKLLLVINYDSLKMNGNKNDFDDLFEHIGEFVKNTSLIYDGIALVATKVENLYKLGDNGTLILSNDDHSVLSGIAKYLREKRETYLHETENSEKYKMLAGLIDTLLQSNNDSYEQIALFRQPASEGRLEELPKTQNEIETIANMTVNNLHYVEITKDDFGFALSESSKIIIQQIIDDIFRNALMDRVRQMGNETLIYYSQLEKQSSDIEMLQNRMSTAFDVMSKIRRVDNPLQLFKKFLDAANTLHLPLSLTNLDIISEDIQKLDFFTTVSCSNDDKNMLLLEHKMHRIITSVGKLRNFYTFLSGLQTDLSGYHSQRLKNDSRILHIIASCGSSIRKVVQNITDLEDIIMEIGHSRFYQRIKTLTLNRFQLKHLSAIFSAFMIKHEFSCQLSQQMMTVKGYNIKMSDLTKIDCWEHAKIIWIFALNKVFMDCTVNKTGEGAQQFIIAPTWEAVGGPKIILDGTNGSPHEEESAKSASFVSENGSDGLPGHPGAPAGHFFGIGKTFINTEFLEIRANGGKGGPGQHGGNGADGVEGQELSKSFFNFYEFLDDVRAYARSHPGKREYPYNFIIGQSEGFPYIYDVLVEPTPFKKPSNGGDGGAGGIGGYPGRIIVNGFGNEVNIKSSNESGFTGPQGYGGHGGKKTSQGRSTVFWYANEPAWYERSRRVSRTSWLDGADVPAGKDGIPGNNVNHQEYPTKLELANPYHAINSFKNFVRISLFENTKEFELQTFLYELENDNQTKTYYNTLAFIEDLEGVENQFFKLRNKIDLVPVYDSFLTRVEEYAKLEKVLENKKVLNYIYTAALTKLFTLKKKRKGLTVVDLSKYLYTIGKTVKDIREAQHLQIVENYRDDYRNILNEKIREAEDFIQNKIEPGIDQLWRDSDNQIKGIMDEINENINSTMDALAVLETKKESIRHMMQMRAVLLPLKLAGASLSFFGPIGAAVGTAVTSVASIAEGMLIDGTPDQDKNDVPSINPNLKIMSRVTKIFDNKNQQTANKLTTVSSKFVEYEQDLLAPESEKVEKHKFIIELKTKLQQAIIRKTESLSDVLSKQKDIEEINKQFIEFTNSEKDILEKKATTDEDAERKKRYEKSLRQIKNIQTIINSISVVFDFAEGIKNDEAMMSTIDNQMSEYSHQLKELENMENQVYDIVIPDLRQIEETINEVENSVNGSSHAKLDLTKWTVRTTLRDVKSMLQKFTQKMSFELQSNIKRFMDKIDEGFSVLIDIYDRIDSYLDSVKQAEYMAHIVSAPMTDIQVTDPKLSSALINFRLIIQSNILFEKYGIAFHAFKQHYFPFAAHFLQKFQLPTNMQLNDTETLRSTIIDKVRDMRNYIDESEATIDEYSKWIHEQKVFNSNTTSSSPFYVWKYDSIKNEVQKLLNGSEILLKADISRGLFYNSVKYNDIGINFKLQNESLQNNLTSILKNFTLTMTMVGNSYYRCGERYFFISLDDDISISYTLDQDENKNWIDPNKVYTTIRNSHTFLSPYAMWSIKLNNVSQSVSFQHLNVYFNETIDLELFGRGYYIEQNPYFNFDVCNDDLNKFYDIENIAMELS